MNTLRTSDSSPLVISELSLAPWPGYLGLTICPGKKDRDRHWDRDLTTDITVIQGWGASTVVTLIEDHELTFLKVQGLGEAVRAAGMTWHHLPIVDVSIPDQRFKQGWQYNRARLYEQLSENRRILIHCRGGLGRTGLVAGVIMVELGFSPEEAIHRVRMARPHAIETFDQEEYVRSTRRLASHE